MTPRALLSFFGAFLSISLVLFVAVREKLSLSNAAFLAGLAIFGAEAACTGFTMSAQTLEKALFWQRIRLGTMSLVPGVWLFFSFAYGHVNLGSYWSKWRWVFVGGVFIPTVLTIVGWQSLILEGILVGAPNRWEFRFGPTAILLNVALLLATVLILRNLERTFRASIGIMRWRIKFLVLGIATIFVARIYTSSQVLLFHSPTEGLEAVNGAALLLGALLISRGLLRAGVFRVDVYPSETFLHGSVTVLLVGLYLLVVGVLARVISIFGGYSALPLKAFLLLLSWAVLAMLLLSDRFRQGVQLFVARHLRRPAFDYRSIWVSLTNRTTGISGQTELCRTMARWISDTFHVLSVTIWIVDKGARQLRLTASTSVMDCEGSDSKASDSVATETLLEALREHEQPFDIENCKGAWIDWVNHWMPDRFKKGGNRVCVPLADNDHVLGVVLLADRVSGVRFGANDLDLLKCVGNQLTASLSNLQLSDQLLEAKEFEAFQAMSAFFVHDLKNTASTLSIMLRNLEEHFGDPDFREDAIRSVAKSVDRIKNLIGSLTVLRQKLEIRPADTDLSALVSSVINETGLTDVRVQTNLPPLAAVRIDAEQIRKVIVNVLLNAYDAVRKDGNIHITTGQQNGWAELTVSDDGCGMTLEFVERRLFRPFQSTKKKGMGIGMYHSKMIVEAHGGKIGVRSQVGRGTEIRIRLPFRKEAM